MNPEPKLSTVAPYRWVGCVVLSPSDVNAILRALPQELHLSRQLRDAAHAAAVQALRLNHLDREGA